MRDRIRRIVGRAESPTIAGSRPLRLSLSLMRQRVEYPLSGNQVAHLAGVHPRQLQRLFRQRIGTTPCRYYTKLRLQHARHLLQTTNLKIVEIAERTGFVSASHFTFRYKETFRVGPKQDRSGLAAPCDLKTSRWEEVKPALANVVEAARQLQAEGA